MAGRLLLLDARSMEWSQLRVPRDPACKACGSSRGDAVQAERIS